MLAAGLQNVLPVISPLFKGDSLLWFQLAGKEQGYDLILS